MKKILFGLLVLLTSCSKSTFNPFPYECRDVEYERYKRLYDAYDQGMVYAYSYVPHFSFLEEKNIPKPDRIYLFTSVDRDKIEFVVDCSEVTDKNHDYCKLLEEKNVKKSKYYDLYNQPVIYEGTLKFNSPYFFSVNGKGIDCEGTSETINFNFYITPDGFIVLDKLSDLNDVDPFSPGYEHTGYSRPMDFTKKYTLDDKNLEYAWSGFSTGFANTDLID